MTELFTLLALFQLKHFLCDFPLQGKYMLGKFSSDPNVWMPALALHALVHALATFAICLWFLWPDNWFAPFVLATFDYWAHFTVDRIKASPNLLGRWKPTERWFWWALGADQMAHHFTHYAIIAALLWGWGT